MARLQIPKPSAFIEGFVKRQGAFKKFKDPADFEQEVVRFIEKHDSVFLATSAKDFPRCTRWDTATLAQHFIYYLRVVGNLPISRRINMFHGQLPRESAAARIFCGCRGCNPGEPQKSFP